ncbi:PREDICTED: uncharacterized protein LOC109242131 [Nicotiana attenuata]|uniref:uncharacterized protein LOC109242131 n=1 Tax=Nicotiana attenuata TaxID=49451 RepID=UPI0009057599|nr:PREDICTED: uncharacterized protein LOC109242131 [Nicotiana attenuata]
MEYLSRSFIEMGKDKLFQYHPRCKKLGITHLSFADDLLLFSRGDLLSTSTLYQYFSQFSKASGLQANMGKSSVYFGGVNQVVKQQILNYLGFVQGELPFKYLGVPLSSKKIALIQWQPLIDRITGKISSWTTKKLSYAGRIQLVKSVIFGIQAYWAHLFILPSKVLKMIDAMCRSYIWSGSKTITRKTYVAWDKMCTPKSTRGMNIINLMIWNKAAIAKVCWDLAHKEDKLCIRWINAYYIKHQQIQTMPIPKQASWMVRRIIASRDVLQQIQCTRGDKETIRHMYLQLLGDLPRMSWKSLVFQNAARPKAIFNLWLMLHGRLPTKDRIASWGMTIDRSCVLCQGQLETRDHLFLHCSYATELWSRIWKWIQEDQVSYSNWQHHLQWIIKKAKGKSNQANICRLVFTEVSYALWLERNNRIFENRYRHCDSIVREIAYICNVRVEPKARIQLQKYLLV